MREIIQDLHLILFRTALSSAPDNHDVLVKMATAFMSFHGLYFKEPEEVEGSSYWMQGIDTGDHFFNEVCPSVIPSEIRFEAICKNFIYFELWEAVHGKADEIMSGLMGAINDITTEYKVTAIAEQKDNIILVSPVNKEAA